MTPTRTRAGLPPDFKRDTTVYGLVFRLDGDRSADHDVRQVLQQHGFTWHDSGFYLGGPRVTAVTAVLAVQELTRLFPWFAVCVRDIRMLRIEEFNDLLPVVRRLAGP